MKTKHHYTHQNIPNTYMYDILVTCACAFHRYCVCPVLKYNLPLFHKAGLFCWLTASFLLLSSLHLQVWIAVDESLRRMCIIG